MYEASRERKLTEQSEAEAAVDCADVWDGDDQLFADHPLQPLQGHVCLSDVFEHFNGGDVIKDLVDFLGEDVGNFAVKPRSRVISTAFAETSIPVTLAFLRMERRYFFEDDILFQADDGDDSAAEVAHILELLIENRVVGAQRREALWEGMTQAGADARHEDFDFHTD